MRRLFISNLLLLGVSCATLPGCTTSEIVNIATSRNPESFVRNRVQGYKSNPLALASDLRRLTRLLSGEVQREWGKQEVILPGRHQYVKYTQNYRSRAIINFDSGEVRIETVDSESPRDSLHSAIVTTLLTPADPRAVDLYSASTIRLSGTPYLHGLLRDQHGNNIDTPAQAEAYADFLLASRLQVRRIQHNGNERLAHSVRLQMVNDHENLRAQRYAHLVEYYATRFDVSRSLVYAVIKTESNFNPFAVSSAPAYGLMQLVPGSGGRDAYRHIKGEDRVPGRDYLFDATNNIELGTGYISVINRQYLAAIHDPVAREYCTIAAYNTGAGNVLRAFSADREQAARLINGMSAAGVYNHLRQHLQQAEARRYLYKVVTARRQFVNL